MKLRTVSPLGVALIFGSAFAGETPSAETLLKSWLGNVKSIENLGPYRVTGTSMGRSILGKGIVQTANWQCVRDGLKLRWDVQSSDEPQSSTAFDGRIWQFLKRYDMATGTQMSGSIVVDPKTDVASELHFQDFEGMGGQYPFSLKPVPGVTLRRRDSGALAKEYLAEAANLRVTRLEDPVETYRLTLAKVPSPALSSLPETVDLKAHGDRFLPVRMTRRYPSPDSNITTVEYRFEGYRQHGSAWFPDQEVMQTTAQNSEGRTAEVAYQERTLKFESLSSPVPSKTFTLDFPKGTDVADQRKPRPHGKELPAVPPLLEGDAPSSNPSPLWLLGLAPMVFLMRKRK